MTADSRVCVREREGGGACHRRGVGHTRRTGPERGESAVGQTEQPGSSRQSMRGTEGGRIGERRGDGSGPLRNEELGGPFIAHV